MGALRGSLTFSRFDVVGDVAPDLALRAMKRLRANVCLPLDPAADDSEHFGWTSIQDSMDTDLDNGKVFLGDHVALSLRVDKWVVPAPLLKATLREAEEKLLAQRGLEKLGRKTKADLKLMVTKKLRKQLVPVTKATDLVWNTTTNVVLFFSQAKKTRELVMALFEKTFGAQLLLDGPGPAAFRRGLSKTEIARFDELVPTTLAQGEAE